MINTILIDVSVIGGWQSQRIFRLSDDEQKWIEMGQIRGLRAIFAVASLNGKIYTTGGRNG